VELAVPLVVLLHFHRMMSSSAAVVTITTAPTAVPKGESTISQVLIKYLSYLPMYMMLLAPRSISARSVGVVSLPRLLVVGVVAV